MTFWKKMFGSTRTPQSAPPIARVSVEPTAPPATPKPGAQSEPASGGGAEDVSDVTDAIALAKIAVGHESSAVRLTAVGKVSDQALLTKISANDRDESVRTAAVEKLSDPDMLTAVALEARPRHYTIGDLVLSDEDTYAGAVAARRLDDQSLLARVAVEAKEQKIREIAVGKLADQALLAEIAVEDRSVYCQGGLSVNWQACQRLEDQSLLAKVALFAKDQSTARAAFDRLTNQTALAQVALKAEATRPDPIILHNLIRPNDSLSLAKAALERLDDQELLGEIALEAKDISVRRGALLKLTDQVTLARIVAGDSSMAEDAVPRLMDPSLLASATRHANPAVRRRAVERVTDQVLLAKIVVEDTEDTVRIAAINRLENQDILEKIALATDQDRSIRCAAVKRVRNQAMLVQIGVGDPESGVRDCAIDSVTDECMLARVVAAGSVFERRLAVKRIDDQIVLAKIGLEDEDAVVRENAARNLSDPDTLFKIATTDECIGVRMVAVERLDDKKLVARVLKEGTFQSIRLGLTSFPASQVQLTRDWDHFIRAAQEKAQQQTE